MAVRARRRKRPTSATRGTAAVRAAQERRKRAREITADPVTESLPDILKRAQGGDTPAARDALAVISALLLTNVHPVSGQPRPLPLAVVRYLAHAFSRMAAGIEPARALNLSRRGKPKLPYLDKRLAVSVVVKALDVGYPIERACEEAERAIQQFVRRSKTLKRAASAWAGIARNPPSAAVLRKWYFELSNSNDI